MKTIKIFYCNSYSAFTNYPHDYTLEIDHDNILRVFKITLNDQYESHEIAVYRNWDYYIIEDDLTLM
jgi:hypothetical protein